MAGPTVRLDLRVALPVIALGVVVLVIIFVELCGREDVAPLVENGTAGERATATLGPTFTPGPSPTLVPGQPTATAEAISGGRDRDVARFQDLLALQEALEQYQQEQGSYPNTEGLIQTLCVFAEFDVGCELEEMLSPLPQDPLGSPTENGYWYTSTGDEFTVFAQRETAASAPVCRVHPEFLEQFDELICVQGP